MIATAMPRIARIVVPGLVHHVTQRGNNRQDVFFVDDDRVAYLRFLASQCQRHRVAIVGYCLMTNHTHLLLVPATARSLAQAVGRTHWLYAQYVNRRHGRSGHVWQNRFYSAAVDDPDVLLVARYVERNPTRARLCRIAQRYAWSSAAAHCTGRDPLGILDLRRWNHVARGLDWTTELAEPLDDRELTRIRQATHTGRPVAGDRRLAKLEHALGRRLRSLPVGRPKGAKTRRRSSTKDRK
jgi:putative transposase